MELELRVVGGETAAVDADGPEKGKDDDAYTPSVEMVIETGCHRDSIYLWSLQKLYYAATWLLHT